MIFDAVFTKILNRDVMKKLFLFSAWLFSLVFADDLPEPYKSIKLLPYNLHGWYGNGEYIEEIMKKYDIHTVVEVGSWAGQSTVHIASLLAENGKLYAVDHWLGSEEHQIKKPWFRFLPWVRKKYRSQLKLSGANLQPKIYQLFLSNVIHKGLAHKIIPLRMSSQEASSSINVKPDLVYIDGDHTYEAVYRDLNAWQPLLNANGIICGDDWSWPAVQKAVNQFAEENNFSIVSKGNFYQLERKQ